MHQSRPVFPSGLLEDKLTPQGNALSLLGVETVRNRGLYRRVYSSRPETKLWREKRAVYFKKPYLASLTVPLSADCITQVQEEFYYVKVR